MIELQPSLLARSAPVHAAEHVLDYLGKFKGSRSMEGVMSGMFNRWRLTM